MNIREFESIFVESDRQDLELLLLQASSCSDARPDSGAARAYTERLGFRRAYRIATLLEDFSYAPL